MDKLNLLLNYCFYTKEIQYNRIESNNTTNLMAFVFVKFVYRVFSAWVVCVVAGQDEFAA